MFNTPSLKELKGKEELKIFALRYENVSGLAVSIAYLATTGVQVFGFYQNTKLIGGFVLASGDEFRSVQLFAQHKQQVTVYKKMGLRHHYTEICCLWLTPRIRQQKWSNLACWFKLSVAIQAHATKFLLFGTCSWGLAALYATSRKAVLIHEDLIDAKHTYIFLASKRHLFLGMSNIILHKMGKMFRITSPQFMHSQKRLALIKTRRRLTAKPAIMLGEVA